MPRPLLLACAAAAALAALLPAAAGAQAVPTAQGRGDELTTAQQIEAWTRDAPPVAAPTVAAAMVGDAARERALGVDSPWADGAGLAPVLGAPGPLIDGAPIGGPPIARTLADGRVHGEAGAEAGNRGYGGYATASAPLGDRGAVQVSVSDFRGSGGRREGWGGGDRRTLGVSAAFDLSPDRRAPAPPAAPAY